MWVAQPEVTLIRSDRPSFELKPIEFRPLELTFSNNNLGPGQWVTLHMQIKIEIIQLWLKKTS